MDLLKFKLTVAYDGTGYKGWQVQKTGTGVQEKIEAALAKLFPSRPRLHSSSRTDTGVHALGMVAHFEVPRTECRMAPRKLALALNVGAGLAAQITPKFGLFVEGSLRGRQYVSPALQGGILVGL